MFGFLRKLFPAQRDRASEPFPEAPPHASPAPAPAARHPAPPPLRPALTAAAPRPAPTTAYTSVAPVASGEEMVRLSLTAIVPQLPPEVLPRINPTAVSDALIQLPRERIASQLASGAVHVSFGEVRLGASPGAIISGSDIDDVQITIPLAEVVARLGNGAFIRRSNQLRMEVPPDITGPFNKDGKGLTIAAQSKSESGQPAPVARAAQLSAWSPASRPAWTSAPAAPRAPVQPVAPAPVALPRPAAPAAAPAFTPPARPAVAPIAAASQSKPANGLASSASASLPKLSAIRPTSAPTTPAAPTTPKLKSAEPTAVAHVAPDGSPTSRTSAAAPVVTVVPGIPVTPAPTAPAAPPVPVPLAAVSERWADAVKQEIAILNLQDATVDIPSDVLELALKFGKVSFTWKLIRSWLRPAPVDAPPSAHDGSSLEIPLQVVAPIFLTQRQNASRRKHVVVDATIPDLFAGKDRVPSPGNTVTPAASQAEVEPAEEMEVTFEPISGAARPMPKPADLMRRAAALEGVIGSLLALQDGLFVAGQVPAPWSGDTLAAFLPQIFGRANQTMRELRLGELNNLSFTVGGAPWLIVRIGGMYFAAICRAGAVLPVAQLTALAAELERKA